MIKKNTKMKNAEHLRKICQWKQSEFTALFGRRCGSKQHLRFHSEGKEWHRSNKVRWVRQNRREDAERKRLARKFNHKDGKSQKAAGREYGIDQSYVCKLLKDLKIKCRTKKTIRRRTLEQAVAAKTKCRILYCFV